MKKFLLAAGLLLAGASAQAQITLEHKYAEQIQVFKLSTGEVKYAAYFPGTSGQVRVYNQNHSILRQVTVPLPAGVDAYVDYVSDRLFNTNSGLEFVLFYSSGAPNYTDKAQVFDEAGASLLQADSCSFIDIRNTPLGTKLITYQRKPTNGNYSKVYSLPGAITALRTSAAVGASTEVPYPNPASVAISLPYLVARGQVGKLVVVDAAGRVVTSYQVDSTFDALLLDAREVRPGVYHYRVESNGSTSPSKKFVVAR